MVKCRYKKVDTIVKYYGNDWSNLTLDGVDFVHQYLRHKKLPYDTELFQKIKNKDLSITYLPIEDYSRHNFNNVNLCCTIFYDETEIPKDKNLFQKIKNKSLYGTRLPEGDYSEYNFNDVILHKTRFTKDSILPDDKYLFQKINKKDLSGAELPRGDYSQHDFRGVNLDFTYFTKDSLLPENEDFFSTLAGDKIFLTHNILKNIHLYNLDKISFLNLNNCEEYKKMLTQKQVNILKSKYPELIGNTIILPEEVLDESNKEIKNNYYEF